MAEKIVVAIKGPTASARNEEQALRRNLRIAIRQLERAELYLVALYSLDLGDHNAELALDTLIRDLRGLRQHLTQSKSSL